MFMRAITEPSADIYIKSINRFLKRSSKFALISVSVAFHRQAISMV